MAEEIARLEAEIQEDAGAEFNVNSPRQLADVLFVRLDLPHGKRTKTGFSTDSEVLEGLRPLHEIAGTVLDYRQAAKLNGIPTDRIIFSVYVIVGFMCGLAGFLLLAAIEGDRLGVVTDVNQAVAEVGLELQLLVVQGHQATAGEDDHRRADQRPGIDVGEEVLHQVDARKVGHGRAGEAGGGHARVPGPGRQQEEAGDAAARTDEEERSFRRTEVFVCPTSS